MLVGIYIPDLQDQCILNFLCLQVTCFFEYQSLIIYIHCLVILFDFLFFEFLLYAIQEI